MKILLLGGTGMLGTSIAPYLLSKGHDVIIHGRGSRAMVSCDLTDQVRTVELLADQKPDAVFHLAAIGDVDRCQREPAVAWRVNAHAAQVVSTALPRSCRYIFISTDQMYDEPGFSTEDQVQPVNIYAMTKLAGELHTIMNGGVALRTNLIGPSLLSSRHSFSDRALEWLRLGKPFPAITDSHLSSLRMTTLAQCMLTVCERWTPGIYNCGARDGLSKRDAIHLIAKAFGLDPSCAVDASSASLVTAAPRPRDMRMDVSLFEKTFALTLPRLEDEIIALSKA